jgi:hypothetical protein
MPELTELPEGPFSRQQAERCVSRFQHCYRGRPGTHFRLVICHERCIVWRAWNFEQDAGYWLNRYIARYGIRKFPA